MLDLCRLSIFVDAEEGHVQIVSRVLKVVGVAAEERDRELWRECQPHVGVFLVAIEVIRPTLIKRDDVAAEFRLLSRFFLDPRDLRLPRRLRLVRWFRRDRFVDAIGHIHDLDKLIEFQVGAGTSSASVLARKPSR